MINQRLMWSDNYFNYDDWEKLQKETYDGFNLLQLPRNKMDTKFFFDRSNHQRIVPQGIFPNAKSRRTILSPRVLNIAENLE